MIRSKRFNFLRTFLASEIPFKFLFRKDISFPHGVGIVISEQAVIGKNVLILSNVVIGGREVDGVLKFPTIEDNVEIWSGAMILGDVTLGKGAKIGAGALILKDVPPGAVAISKSEQVIISHA